MKETGPIVGIYHENATKITIKGRIMAIFRTRKIGEDIKIIIKTNIGINHKISMKVIGIQMILIVEIGHMAETNHTIEIGLIVEIGHEAIIRDQRHKRRHRDYHENKCKDGYISDYDDSSRDRYDKGNHRTKYKKVQR